MENMKFTAFNLADRNAQDNIINKYFDLSIFFLIGVHSWKNFIPHPDSIIFLIDVGDQYCFAEAKAKLHVRISFF